MVEYLENARALGFTKAIFLDSLVIECKPELRAYCNPQQCTKHGQNWVCPPGCGTLEECREKVLKFNKGILLQSVTELVPPTLPETFSMLSREHNLHFKEFVESVKPGVSALLPLSTGGCVLCEECSYPAPCVKPDLKMESLSAFGIDVTALCENSGLPYSFCPEVLYLTALLLF